MNEASPNTVEEGSRLLQAGDTAGALVILSQIVAAEPQNGKAFGLLGITFAKLGDMDSAISTLQEAARLLPQDVSVRYNLANAMFQAKRMQEARAVAEGVLRLSPGHANAGALLQRIAAAAATGGAGASPIRATATLPAPLAPSAPPAWNPQVPQPSNQPAAAPPANWNPALAPPPPGMGATPLGGPSHLGGVALDGTPIAQPAPYGAGLPQSHGMGLPPPPGLGLPPLQPGMSQPGIGLPPPGMGLPPTPGRPGMSYMPPTHARSVEEAPGLALRLGRGIFWGGLCGQVWTFWTIFWTLVWSAGSLGKLASPEGGIVIGFIFVFIAIVYGIAGSIVGFIIGAMDADDDAGAIVGIVVGLILCGLEWLISRGMLGFVNIFFYYFTGRLIGTMIANRVQKSVIR